MYSPTDSFSFKNPDLSTLSMPKADQKKKSKGEASLDVGRSFVLFNGIQHLEFHSSMHVEPAINRFYTWTKVLMSQCEKNQ